MFLHLRLQKIRILVFLLFIGGMLFLSSGCSKSTPFSKQREVFVEKNQNTQVQTGIETEGKIEISSGATRISGFFLVKTILDGTSERNAFYLAWSTKKAFDTTSYRFLSGIRYWTPQSTFLRLDSGYNNGKSAEASLLRGLLNRIYGQRVVFDPKEDMGIINQSLMFQKFFFLSPTSVIRDVTRVQTGQTTVSKEKNQFPLFGFLFPRKETQTHLQWLSIDPVGEQLVRSIFYLLDPTSKYIKTKEVKIEMTGMSYHVNNEIVRIEANITVPEYNQGKCSLRRTKKIHTGFCTDGKRMLARSYDRLGSETQVRLRTPYETIDFIGKVIHKNSAISIKGVVEVKSKNTLDIPVKLKVLITLRPLVDLHFQEKLPQTGYISFEELLQ